MLKGYLSEEKRIDTEQTKTDQDIQAFQTEKQKQLNQIYQVVNLRLSQIQNLTLDEFDENAEDVQHNCRLPPTLGDNVVFTATRMRQLMNRITELRHEERQVKEQFTHLQRYKKSKAKENKEMQKIIGQLTEKFTDIQMLKFGQQVGEKN